MVSFEIKHHVFYIYVEGDIFAVTTSELKNAFQEAWRKKTYKVILDVSKGNLINSSGVGVIVGALKTCHEPYHEGDLVLVNPPRNIKRTLRIMGIDQFITTKDTIKEAEDYLRSKKGTDKAPFS